MAMAFVALALAAPGLPASDQDRIAAQQELDAACEAARAKQLAADRQRLVAECVRDNEANRADCEAEYSNYGERSGSRPPLYYNLPECEAALEFQQSTRRSR